LLAKDEGIRRHMGLMAKETVQKFYNADDTWKEWLKVFESVADNRLTQETVSVGGA
jgi:hypothetical protein